jgi:CRISPR-associated protein Cas2
MYLLITYDIEDTRKRTKLAALLEQYGERVNYSVFELDIHRQMLDRHLPKIEALSDKQDSVRIYRFTKETISHSFELLDGPEPFQKESGYVD